MTPVRYIAIIVIAAALLGFLVFRIWNRPISPAVEMRQAPEVSLQDYVGQEVKLSDFRGKPLIVNVWATWCPFCAEELRSLATIQKEFGEKITIAAINRAEPPEAAKNYSDSLGLTEKITFLLDPDDSFYKSLNGFSMPETIFVDKSGAILFHKRGRMTEEELRRHIHNYFGF